GEIIFRKPHHSRYHSLALINVKLYVRSYEFVIIEGHVLLDGIEPELIYRTLRDRPPEATRMVFQDHLSVRCRDPCRIHAGHSLRRTVPERICRIGSSQSCNRANRT